MAEQEIESPRSDADSTRPGVDVAVVMRREHIDNRWQPWRWVLADVVQQEEGFGTEPRLLLRSEQEERWLYPGFRLAGVPRETRDTARRRRGLLPQCHH